MKFKIKKEQLDRLSRMFNENDQPYEEIDLEPVYETATSAIIMNSEKIKSFEIGYEKGYQDGLLDQARNERDVRMGLYRTKCSCIPRGFRFCRCI